jgi:hypothetical protein
MKRVTLLGLTVIAALALVPGCEFLSTEDSGSGDGSGQAADYGGFTVGNEAPGFGDKELVAYPEGEAYDDHMEDYPDVEESMEDAGAKHYSLRLVWGNLASRDSSVLPGEDCPVTDWSGYLEVDGGHVLVRRLIRFDPYDRIVRPRPGPDRVEWVSATQPAVDGIVFHVIDVPEADGIETSNTLVVSLPMVDLEIPLADLADHKELMEFDECNKLSVVATEIEYFGCPRGFIEGRWIAETDTSGIFKGIWIGHFGGIRGYLKGTWEAGTGGERELYGKWISRGGSFGGLISGTWTPLSGGPCPHGRFEGEWVNEFLTVEGHLGGHYCACRDSAGFFHGRWVEHCR